MDAVLGIPSWMRYILLLFTVISSCVKFDYHFSIGCFRLIWRKKHYVFVIIVSRNDMKKFATMRLVSYHAAVRAQRLCE
jgi:hypothetical protein